MSRLLAILTLCAVALAASAAEPIVKVQLTWTMPTNNMDGTPLTDLAGAKVYYGTSSSNYTEIVDVGLTNRTFVTGLQANRLYFFNGTAYNTAGLESDFCDEVAKGAFMPGPLTALEVEITVILPIKQTATEGE